MLTHFSFIFMVCVFFSLLFRKGREKAERFLPDLGPCHEHLAFLTFPPLVLLFSDVRVCS